jgi:Protein of unknown function (DUF2892)
MAAMKPLQALTYLNARHLRIPFLVHVWQRSGTMTLNVGTIDRVVRVIVGLALLAFAIPIAFPNTGWNWVGWIGVVPLLTAVFGYCPAYSLFGTSTCPKKVRA